MIIRILAVVLSRSVSIFQCTLCCFEGLCTCAGLWSLGGPPSLVPGPAVELSWGLSHDEPIRWRVRCNVGVIPHLQLLTIIEAFVWREFLGIQFACHTTFAITFLLYCTVSLLFGLILYQHRLADLWNVSAYEFPTYVHLYLIRIWMLGWYQFHSADSSALRTVRIQDLSCYTSWASLFWYGSMLVVT